MKGYIHSFESFGTVDGPGIRFVIFMKGCPLRCAYCHNPDTWTFEGAKEYEPEEILKQVSRYKKYYGDTGGVTISGGEPLVQIDFVIELAKLLKENNINVCIDTSGILFSEDNEKYLELIKYVDLFLLDIKHINNEEHVKLTGKENINVLKFAKFLDSNNKDVWIRHVLVPNITSNDTYLNELNEFIKTLHNVKKIEVLPYHTLGINKYEKLGIPYKLEGVEAPSKDEVENAKRILGIIK